MKTRTGKLDDLATIQQRARHRLQAVTGTDEQDLAEIHQMGMDYTTVDR